MIPETFDYHRPSSVDEALKLLSENEEAKILSGGHSLIPAMKLRLASPEALIDLGSLKDLCYIKEEGDHLVIGATATHHMIETDELVARHAPILAETASQIGDPAVRNRGTVGGSLAHADPAADYPGVFLALGGELVVKGPDAERSIPIDEFFIDLFLTSLSPDEIITAIKVPKATDAGYAYLKFPNPASRYAVVGAAVQLRYENGTIADLRLGMNGVANAAYRETEVEDALNGQEPSEDAVAAAAAEAAEDQEILSDQFADEAYRKHLAKVFAKRAILKAVQRAGA